MGSTDEQARNLMAKVLSSSRPGILTDIDGTISRIAPSPSAATVEPAARAALSHLTDQLTLTGAVTGRAAIDAREMVRLDRIIYSGNHGMELWRNGELVQSPLALRYEPIITRVLDSLQSPGKHEGVIVENKVLTASIHYRTTSNPEDVESEILGELNAILENEDLVITRGRKVIELRPPVELSKGTSVVELANLYELDGLIYLGDDVTDVDAFRALAQIREEQGLNFFSIGVRNDPTPPEVIESADALVDGVDGVVELLEWAIEQHQAARAE